MKHGRAAVAAQQLAVVAIAHAACVLVLRLCVLAGLALCITSPLFPVVDTKMPMPNQQDPRSPLHVRLGKVALMNTACIDKSLAKSGCRMPVMLHEESSPHLWR